MIKVSFGVFYNNFLQQGFWISKLKFSLFPFLSPNMLFLMALNFQAQKGICATTSASAVIWASVHKTKVYDSFRTAVYMGVAICTVSVCLVSENLILWNQSQTLVFPCKLHLSYSNFHKLIFQGYSEIVQCCNTKSRVHSCSLYLNVSLH
jgi:hypothetical protein